MRINHDPIISIITLGYGKILRRNTETEAERRTDKPRELLAANPNGKVPAFIDGDIAMFEGCGIIHYILDHYDFDRALGDKRDKEFSAALYKLSFYASGTVDNLFATSSPIQGGPIVFKK